MLLTQYGRLASHPILTRKGGDSMIEISMTYFEFGMLVATWALVYIGYKKLSQDNKK